MINLSGITSSSINLISQPPVFDFPTGAINSNPLSNQFIGKPCTDTAREAEQLVSQLDHLFGYHKGLNTAQEKQVNRLFDKIDIILQSNASAGPNKEQQTQLDKLFDEIDEIYQARSYESLTPQEHKIVDSLLDQLDVALT